MTKGDFPILYEWFKKGEAYERPKSYIGPSEESNVSIYIGRNFDSIFEDFFLSLLEKTGEEICKQLLAKQTETKN
jgi:hypothetical protein